MTGSSLSITKRILSVPATSRLHLVKALHHLDEADHVALGDRVAIALVGRLVGRRRAVEGAGQRRQDLGHYGLLQVGRAATAARTARAMSTALGVSEWMQIVSQRVGKLLPSVAVPRPSVMARTQRRSHFLWVLGVMFAGDDQRAVGAIVEIGVEFGDEAMAACRIDRFVQRAGHAQDRHVEDVGGVADRMRDLLLPRGHAVEAAVRLDVVERHALGLEKPAQRADLVDHAVGHLVAAHLHLAPAEALAGRAARDGRRP